MAFLLFVSDSANPHFLSELKLYFTLYSPGMSIFLIEKVMFSDSKGVIY